MGETTAYSIMRRAVVKMGNKEDIRPDGTK
jgi:hypothetical protein